MENYLLRLTLVAIVFWQQCKSQAPQNPLPCTDDCLQEALAGDPVKGCTVGTVWVPWPAENPRDACRPCPKGWFCPAIAEPGVNIHRKVPCPIGTYMDHTGAESLSHCKNCSHGYYQDWYGQPSCLPCPAGTYIDAARSISIRECKDCWPGHYCPSGSPIPTPCPAGTYTSYPRMRELANCLPCLPGHFCHDGTDLPVSCPGGSYADTSGFGTVCKICPPSFFCPTGSVLPVSCPPGKTSGANTSQQSDCVQCPIGYQCRALSNASLKQSLVVRGANGEDHVGSVAPEACPVDTTVRHFDYLSVIGCMESCPFVFPHQSYCHVAGDGRVPDRNAALRALSDTFRNRVRRGPASHVEQNDAFDELNRTLALMGVIDRRNFLTMPDENGRTPYIIATMLCDTGVIQLLWTYVPNDAVFLARDVGGYTALMHALRLGCADMIIWLTSTTQSTLAADDVSVLVDLGVSVAGVPVHSLAQSPAYLGRGSLTWTGIKMTQMNETPSTS